MRVYTGIGSRRTTPKILTLMTHYGREFARLGFILRSGGAPGADSAFEKGCIEANGLKEIYLPWKGFNSNPSPLFHIPPAATKIAAEVYGKGWTARKPSVHKLMSRNVMQVLGKNLDQESEFVICYTPDGAINASQRTKHTGGTGQAIALASLIGVTVYNLYHEFDIFTVDQIIQELDIEAQAHRSNLQVD